MTTTDQLISQLVAKANMDLLEEEAKAFRSYEAAIADADLDENASRKLLADYAGELEMWRSKALVELHGRLAATLGVDATRQ